jgi:RNA polymerase sigma-70 factor (ECF subfamily)
MLEPLLADPGLERYQLAARGPRRAAEPRGHAAGAVRAYKRAIALTSNAVERTQLERRLGALR